MYELIYFDEGVSGPAATKIGAVPVARLYGKGLFTTVAITIGKPFLWKKHWRRLATNASTLGIDLSGHGEEKTLNALLEIIAKSGLTNGRARITFADESPSGIWSQKGKHYTSLTIILAERRPMPEKFKLTTSPHRLNTTSPLVGLKSCNYLEHLLAYEEASKRGFHEAIRLNEHGEIASACMANVFWEKDGKLFTPSLKTGCLPGITREYLLENVECEEGRVGIEDLQKADRIFVTSSGIGVVSVGELDGKLLETSEHELSKLLPF